MKICRAVFLSALVFAAVARGYVVDTDDSGIYVAVWEPGVVAMQIKLPTSPTLLDGSNYASSVQAAMAAWNGQLGVVQFTSQITNTPINPPAGTYSTDVFNTVNEIVMDRTYDGLAFDSNTLAVTTTVSLGNTRLQSDMVINSAWTWDSFRGGRFGNTQDIRRVVIHELGHVLGLQHPDQAVPPQLVTAIMNSQVSYFPSIDTMQGDDIAGAQLLYGAPGFSPANDNFQNAATIVLAGTSIHLTGTNIAATRQTGEPSHVGANAPGGHSVWWRWTAPGNGVTTITTLGSNFDTVLGVYTGASVAALTAIASNDDEDVLVSGNDYPQRKRTSLVTFNAVGGTTYFIAVDGWGSVAQGDSFTFTGAITLDLAYTESLDVAPTITTQPASQTVNAGQAVQFTAAASGVPAPTYQWQKGGVAIGGATASSYTIASVTAADAGSYTMVATNASGSVTSNAAVLGVVVAPSNVVITITVE